MRNGSASVEATTLTWVGGGNNLASNPADWTPAAAPEPGNTLVMNAGVMNIEGDALAGDTLSLAAFSKVQISTSHHAALNLSLPEPGSTVNLSVAEGSTLTLNAQIVSGNLNATGGTIRFIGSNTFDGFTTTLSDNLQGNATLNLNGQNGNGETMTVAGRVGPGLNFNLAGTAPDATLQIDDPGKFFGSINLTTLPVGVGHVGFEGIHATSADLFDGLLFMFNGSKLVDATRVSGGDGLHLYQTAAGVNLTSGSNSDIFPGNLGTAIPLHVYG